MSQFLQEDERTDAASTPRVDYASVVASKTSRRRKRRTITWAIFGVIGLGLGAVWAAGVVTSESNAGVPGDASPLLATPGGGSSPRFQSVLTAGQTELTIGASGKTGVISADARLFQIDLDQDDPATAAVDTFSGTYFATIELTNDVSNSGWATLNLEFTANEGACATGPLDINPGAVGAINSVLHVETSDSTVDLTGLQGGTTYCVGIHGLGNANDIDGTYIRKTTGGANPTMPTFAAFMAQSAT